MRTSSPRRARKWPYRGAPNVVSWPGCPSVSQARWPCCGRVRAQARPCPGLPHDTTACLKPLWSQYTLLYCDTILSCQPLLVTIQSLVLQYKPPQPPTASVMIQILYRDTAFPNQLPLLSQYTNCIVTQSSPGMPSLRSQYNNCIVTQCSSLNNLPLSQYTQVYCDTLPSHPRCLSHNTLSLFATLLVTIQFVYCDPTSAILPFAIQIQGCNTIFFFPFCNTLLPIAHPKA